MVEHMPQINDRFAEPIFGRTLSLKIGVHRGEVISGNIGSERKMEYGVVGDTVNTASRIRDVARNQGHDILISGAVKYWLEDDAYPCEELGEVALRGLEQPIGLHRILTHG